jgi:hypothetical protein
MVGAKKLHLPLDIAILAAALAIIAVREENSHCWNDQSYRLDMTEFPLRP